MNLDKINIANDKKDLVYVILIALGFEAISEGKACELLGISRSDFYSELEKPREESIIRDMYDRVCEEVDYSTTHLLQKYNFPL